MYLLHVIDSRQQLQSFSFHLKVLVVVRIDAETGDKTVHHELYISVLAARPPPEGFGWVEQQSLRGQRRPRVTSDDAQPRSNVDFYITVMQLQMVHSFRQFIKTSCSR